MSLPSSTTYHELSRTAMAKQREEDLAHAQRYVNNVVDIDMRYGRSLPLPLDYQERCFNDAECLASLNAWAAQSYWRVERAPVPLWKRLLGLKHGFQLVATDSGTA
jgi:hypothetical protein